MSEERDLMEVKYPENGGGISVAGMVLGIVAAVFAHIPFLCVLGLLLSIPAVICANKGRKRATRKGIAVTGLVLGWVAFGVSIFMCVYTGVIAYVFLELGPGRYGSLEEWIQQTYTL